MKLGLIVEGDWDKVIAESLAKRVLPPSVHVQTVRLGGKAALTTAYTTVFTFLSRGYEHAVLLFDADSSIAEVVAERRRRVEASLVEHHVSDRATAIPVVPVIEA